MIVGIVLVAVAAVAGVFGTAMITDAWQEGKGAAPQSNLEPLPAPEPKPAPQQKPMTAAEKREAQRRAFVDSRRPLQEAVMDADGELVAHQLDASGIGQIRIPNGEQTYTIPTSKNGGRDAWVYNTDPSFRRLLRVGSAQRHELIDVADLPLIDRDISIPIGDAVVLEATDGSMIQLLLVDAHLRANGDQTDDVSFRYRIYPAGTSQIRALRNGEG
jgi:hypothetical protein